MSEIEYESIKQLFDELDENYENRWEEEKQKIKPFLLGGCIASDY